MAASAQCNGTKSVTEKIVIVGAGHASGQVIASLKQKKHDCQITLIGDEAHYPYQRPPLSKKFLAGEMPAERLYFKPPSFYDDDNIDVVLNTHIDRIDRVARTVVDERGQGYSWDKLVLATGARVRKLSAPGCDLDGIHYLRNIQDVTAMQGRMTEGCRLVVIGAGYIGLEVAAVAAGLGLDVTVIEMADRVMSRVVCPVVSEFYQREHADHGVKLKLSASLNGISGNERVEQVDLADGSSIPADMVLIGIGVIPNVELAADAGLDVDNGIRVNDRCNTSDPDIFAIGDCTNHPNSLLDRQLRLESVHNALEQAKTAASNICGEHASYAQVPWFWSDQFDLKLQIAGISTGYDETVVRGDPSERSFSCLYLREGALIAVDSINAPRDFMQSKPLIADKVVIRREDLADTGRQLKELS
jgi:3-phenylpropionate/trans-cinnamate dioxygenase ferredoxin reductase subunit